MRSVQIVISMILLFRMLSPAAAQQDADFTPERGGELIKVDMGDSAAFMIGGNRVSLGGAIHMVLERNKDTLTGTYDAAMVDTMYKKFLRKYALNIDLEGGYKYQKFPESLQMMSGEEQRSWDVSAALSKYFSSGTFVSAGIMHTYSKTEYIPINLMGNQITFGDPEYNRPVLFVSIQQELLKNSFGYNERRQKEILKNTAKMQREALVFQLAGLVVQTVIDYWSVLVGNSGLENARLQLRETKRVRNITAQNVRLGLGESYDLNYYNTLVATSEGRVAQAEQEYRDTLRRLLRTLNLESNLELTGTAVLSNKLPVINVEKSIETAYSKRADYKGAQLMLDSARRELELYKNEDLPSVMAILKANTMGQRKEQSDAYEDAGKNKYPSWEARLKVSYPLDNTEQKANKRNARYKLEQAKLQFDKYQRLVKDEVVSSVERIKTDYELYQKAREARVQAELYYRKILVNMRRGRVTNAVVKNALDAMIDSRQRELNALVQYNITLLRYDLATNFMFDRYKIDVNAYIPN